MTQPGYESLADSPMSIDRYSFGGIPNQRLEARVHGELLFKLPWVTGIAHGNENSTGIGGGQHGGG